MPPLVFLNYHGWDRENGRYINYSVANLGTVTAAWMTYLLVCLFQHSLSLTAIGESAKMRIDRAGLLLGGPLVALIRIIIEKGLPKGTLLNVNVPAVDKSLIKGVKIVNQSKIPIEETFDKRIDPRKQTYYWLTGELVNLDGEDASDIKAVKDNYISIVPLQFDMTNYDFLDVLRGWGGVASRI